MTTTRVSASLDGRQLRAAFVTASQYLADASASIDAINVYPVPDGDTGSNMAATLRDAVESTATLGPAPSVAEMLSALARGALYGARGNSGVILSQALHGFAVGVAARHRFDARCLADGLAQGSRAAYAAVSRPAEGTMLSVLRRAAGEATRVAATFPDEGRGAACVPVLEAAIAAAESAQRDTTSQLPALAEAGVPDAGGEGICEILRGLHTALSGRSPNRGERPLAPRPALPRRDAAAAVEHDTFGFCTEFIVEQGQTPVDIQQLRILASQPGSTSVMVVGDEYGARVHLHTLEPQAVLTAAERYGHLSRIKVDDMDAQHSRLRFSWGRAGVAVGMLAVSRGAGFDSAFEGLGSAVCDLGQNAKPASGDLAARADALGLPEVVLLPNHANVLLAARQAAGLARCTLHIVPTRSLAEGIAAAVAFDPRRPGTSNVEAMTEAAARVRTVEIATATASRSIDSHHIRAGDAVAFLDGEVIATGPSLCESLMQALDAAGAQQAALVTLYRGASVEEADARSVRAQVAQRYPAVEVELVDGGHDLYAYIASVES